MNPYNFVPLPPAHTVRDPNFVTPEEASAVAASLLADPVGKTINTQADGSQITGLQMIPQTPNIYPDGRIFVVLQFTLMMEVTNSMGRKQIVPVGFQENAGLLYDFINKNQPWEFIAESAGKDLWIGDVEKGG